MAIIISELGHNHNGDMERMLEMIRVAKKCGANVAKTQLYDIDKISKPSDEWYLDLKRGQLSKKDWLQFFGACMVEGIEPMASVFDVERVKWCEEAGVKRYKIASRSIYDKELIGAVVATGKPIIASLGMYNEPEFPDFKADYLYCVAKYPTPLVDIEFPDFYKYAGFSDHTIGLGASLLAIAKGARIIEKHFTLDKNLDGADHKGSMTPEELKQLVDFNTDFELMML